MSTELSKKDLSHLVKSKITAAMLEINHGAVSSKNVQKAIKKGVKLISAELHKHWKVEAEFTADPVQSSETVKKARAARKKVAKAGSTKSEIKKTNPKKAAKKVSVTKKTVKKSKVAKKTSRRISPAEKTVVNTETAS